MTTCLPDCGVWGLAALLAVAACAEPTTAPEPPRPTPTAPTLAPDTLDVRGVTRAVARVEPVGGGGARGTVRLLQTDAGVRVRAELEGLSQSDFHALQVLRGRGCDADPAVHLGAEAGTPHGGPYSLPGERHAGDLGNVRGDGGAGRYDRIDPVLSLSGTGSAVGRAVVVRAGRDDAASPDGAAGEVVGCGVLEPRG
jgi:Cu/Zn superoxide dismutase